MFLLGEGNGNPLQYSCLANPMDGGAWYAAVHGLARGWTQLSDFTFTLHFPALEKELYNAKECRGEKKIVLSSSFRIPDPSLLGDP